MTTKQPALDDISPDDIAAAAKRRAEARAARERELAPKPAKSAPKTDPKILAAVAGAARLAHEAAMIRARQALDAAAKPRTNEQIVKAAKAFDLNSIPLTPEQQRVVKLARVDVDRYRMELLKERTLLIRLSTGLQIAASMAAVEHEIVKAVLTPAEREQQARLA